MLVFDVNCLRFYQRFNNKGMFNIFNNNKEKWSHYEAMIASLYMTVSVSCRHWLPVVKDELSNHILILILTICCYFQCLFVLHVIVIIVDMDIDVFCCDKLFYVKILLIYTLLYQSYSTTEESWIKRKINSSRPSTNPRIQTLALSLFFKNIA